MRNANAFEFHGSALGWILRRAAIDRPVLRAAECCENGLVLDALRVEVERRAQGQGACVAKRRHGVSWLNVLPSEAAPRCSAPPAAALTCPRRRGSSGVTFASKLGSVCFTQGGRAWQHSSVRPNTSFKRSANGRPPGPRGAFGHHAPRGPGVLPLSPA
jgi:hypothetical protein